MFQINPAAPFEGVDAADFDRWFPKRRDLPPEGTFEFGLVLAGAVSAGAYSAGVMDFLLEALDRWYAAKTEGADIPQHKVSLRIATGASAGGMNAAILAAACRKRFPHVRKADADENGRLNPFYDAWVRGIRIEDLLATGDLEDGASVRSILNCQTLSSITDRVLGFQGEPAEQAHRTWLEDPFRVVLTLTNLAGVPYAVRFSGVTGLYHEMTLHRDQICFGVPVFERVPSKALPPNVLVLSQDPAPTDEGWHSLGIAALATGAFPLALEPRLIARQPTDYEYRYAYINSKGEKIFSKPWPSEGPDVHQFFAVDGGTMNNEPFEIARSFLSGSRAHNERDGAKAQRAIIMIDPYSDAGEPYEFRDPRLHAVGARLLTAFKQQTRFSQLDLSLAEAGDVYSRFMIAPSRRGKKGKSAIASGGLGGFLGFFHEAFRHHDFLLGRANCQRFLRDWFVLPKENPLFTSGTWSEAALNDKTFKSRRQPDHLQIIPLVNGLDEDLERGEWPAAGTFAGYSGLRGRVENRVDAVYETLRDELLANVSPNTINRGIAKCYVSLPWRIFGRRKLLKVLEEAIDSAAQGIARDSI